MSDMIDLELDQEVFVSFAFDLKTIRILDNTLIPSQLNIRAEVIDQEKSDDFDLDVAFAKIRYWFEQIVSKGIMFSRDNEFALGMCIGGDDHENLTGNTLVVCPYDPTDEHLAELFQSKMNALAGGAVTFGIIEVKSDNLEGLTFTFTGDGEHNLPVMEEWIGERTFFSKPWWARNDASTLDVVPSEDADLTKPPAFALSLDFLGDLMRPTQTEGAMVVRPEFRPTVIDGGKK